MKTLQVVLPMGIGVLCQVVQVVPVVQAAVVAVGKSEFEGVLACGLDVGQADFSFACLQFFLAVSVTAHFGAGRVNAQQFGTDAVIVAIGVA